MTDGLLSNLETEYTYMGESGSENFVLMEQPCPVECAILVAEGRFQESDEG